MHHESPMDNSPSNLAESMVLRVNPTISVTKKLNATPIPLYIDFFITIYISFFFKINEDW